VPLDEAIRLKAARETVLAARQFSGFRQV